MAGTGIGTFNDRIRDAIRGGSPFGDRREQGFATGLFTRPERLQPGPGRGAGARSSIRRTGSGSAWRATSRAYRFIDHTGREMRGGMFEGVGYTARAAARPSTTSPRTTTRRSSTRSSTRQRRRRHVADRVRMQKMGLSIVASRPGDSVLPRRQRHAPLQVDGRGQLQLRRLVQQARLELRDEQLRRRGCRPRRRTTTAGTSSARFSRARTSSPAARRSWRRCTTSARC